jgi:hypothetical protein
MCFAAYAGIFSYLGLASGPNRLLLHWLLVGALVINIAFLAVRFVQHRVHMRLLVVTSALATLLLGKYLFESPLLVYGGLTGLLCVVVWNSGRQTVREITPRN